MVRTTYLTLLPLLWAGCAGLTPYNPSGLGPQDTDTDTDTDSDTDTDTDSDTDTDTDSDTDTDTDADPIQITQIDPDFGTTAGGTEVTFSGGPFDNSAEVRFNGALGTVLNATSDSMLVRTPSGTEGIADVEVSTNTGFGARSEAFTYWMDGTGLTGLVGEFSWFHFVGDYWSSTPQDFGAANFVFLLPTDFEYWQFYSDTMDTCRNNYSLSSSIQVYEPNYGSVQMVAPDGGAVPIPKSIDYAYLYETQDSTVHNYFVQGGTYSLQAPKAAPWPELDITSALRTPNAFQVTSPAINATFPPYVSSSFSLNWTGSGGDYVLAILQRYDGTTLTDSVTCALIDDRSFQVPSSVWSGWTPDSQLSIILGRAATGTGTVPLNNSDAKAIGVYWIYGAAFSQ